MGENTKGQTKRFDQPLLPDMAARVVKTTKTGAKLTPEDYAEAVRLKARPFQTQFGIFVREALLSAVKEEKRRELTLLYRALEQSGPAEYLPPLPHHLQGWVYGADRSRMRFYFAWCMLLARIGEAPLPHYVATLQLNCPQEVFSGNWCALFAELAAQERQHHAEKTLQTA